MDEVVWYRLKKQVWTDSYSVKAIYSDLEQDPGHGINCCTFIYKSLRVLLFDGRVWTMYVCNWPDNPSTPRPGYTGRHIILYFDKTDRTGFTAYEAGPNFSAEVSQAFREMINGRDSRVV